MQNLGCPHPIVKQCPKLYPIFKGNDAGDVGEMGKRDVKESAGEELSFEFPDEGKK